MADSSGGGDSGGGGAAGGITASGVFGAVGDLFGAIGDFSEGAAYSAAAKYAGQNALISRQAGQIQKTQEERKIFQVIGAQGAQIAGAGFTTGGSSGDIYRSSMAQGGLQKALIQEQTNINVNGYLAEEAQYKGMAQAANAAGIGGIIGGIGKLFGFL